MPTEMDSIVEDNIEACRTCGVFFLTSSQFLKHIFNHSPENEHNMKRIRTEVASWDLNIIKGDNYPQYICTYCILDFQKMFNFRQTCVDTQQRLKEFYSLGKNIQIKTEVPDPTYNEVNDFIYVDDLSDDVYDGTPFSVTHVPIKTEIIDEDISINDTMFSKLNTSSNIPYTDSYKLNLEMPNQSTLVTSVLNDTLHKIKNGEETHQTSRKSDKGNESNFQDFDYSLSSSEEDEANGDESHKRRSNETQNFVCHICGKLFEKVIPQQIKSHLKGHAYKEHKKCEQCNYYSNVENLNKHLHDVHNKVECKICGNIVDTYLLENHMEEHINQMEYPCSYCDEVFSSEDSRENHIWEVHANDEFDEQIKEMCNEDQSECSEIDYKTHTGDNKIKHNEISAEFPIKNQLIQSTNSKLSSTIDSDQYEFGERTKRMRLENETQVIDNNQSSFPKSQVNFFINENKEMDYDDNSSSYMSSIKGFESALDNDKDTEIESETENQTETDTEQETDMEIQNKSDNMDEVSNCSKFSKSFNDSSELTKHYISEHMKKSKEDFKCHICLKSFPLKFILNRHLLKH